MKAIKQIESPCEMPNGLQWTDEGLFVMDQKTDNVYVVDETGRLLRTINTPTANGSGITVGGGYLWTASTLDRHRSRLHLQARFADRRSGRPFQDPGRWRYSRD